MFTPEGNTISLTFIYIREGLKVKAIGNRILYYLAVYKDVERMKNVFIAYRYAFFTGFSLKFPHIVDF